MAPEVKIVNLGLAAAAAVLSSAHSTDAALAGAAALEPVARPAEEVTGMTAAAMYEADSVRTAQVDADWRTGDVAGPGREVSCGISADQYERVCALQPEAAAICCALAFVAAVSGVKVTAGPIVGNARLGTAGCGIVGSTEAVCTC